MASFPAPVGGVPLPSDFVPCIIFAALYGLLFPLSVYRLLHRRSRNTLIIGTLTFSVERVVIFTLKAIQARNATKRDSQSLAVYMQLTIGMGFVSMTQDLVNLVRCLLVNATKGSKIEQDPSAKLPAPHTSDGDLPDEPRQRFWSRRFTDLVGLSCLAAVVSATIAGLRYSSAMKHEDVAKYVYRLRYASCAVTLCLIFIMSLSILWARTKFPRIDRTAAKVLFILCGLLVVVSVYRLAVMSHQQTSLDSIAPGSLNTTAAKATFYIFHMLPEWIFTAVILGVNVRQVFNTGPFGDYRGVDETEGERRRIAKVKTWWAQVWHPRSRKSDAPLD